MPTDATTAEMCKLMENTFRDVNIALANEFALVAEHLGVDVREAIKLANHHPRVNIHAPGIGVGGHCIPVDPWFIVHAAPEETPLMRTARAINNARPQQMADSILQTMRQHPGKPLALLGLSYKPDVDDIREVRPRLRLSGALPQTRSRPCMWWSRIFPDCPKRYATIRTFISSHWNTRLLSEKCWPVSWDINSSTKSVRNRLSSKLLIDPLHLWSCRSEVQADTTVCRSKDEEFAGGAESELALAA